MNTDIIGSIKIPLPSLLEQQTIVDYLDRETVEMDALIAEQEELISLLKQKRSAIISEAVCRGLDSTVPMKDSGIEWLGMMPIHWQMKKIKYISKFYSGSTPPKNNLSSWNGSVSWVSPKDMKCKDLYDSIDHLDEECISQQNMILLPKNNLLMVVRSGILKHSIPVSRNRVDVTFNQDIKGIIPNLDISAEFFYYFIHGNQSDLLFEWRKQGATVESLELDLVLKSYMGLPPISEQQAIVDYLDRETAEIDHLIADCETSIQLLKQRRTALISEAVTGKIDLRTA